MTDDSDSSADKDKFVKRIEEILSDEMEDYSVVILSDYANEVEYGSPPIHIRETKLPKVKDGNEEVTVARKNIRDWVAKKYNVSGKDRITQGDRMYRHIMDHGTKPHPFIRPSIRDAENMKPADIMQMCEGENFMESYAKFMAERMKYHLRQNDSVATGALISSIVVMKSEDVPPNMSKFDTQRRENN